MIDDYLKKLEPDCSSGTYIYGDGEWGHKLLDYLQSKQIGVSSFIVSCKTEKKDVIPISSIDDYNFSDKALFFVAVSSQYWDEIKRLISQNVKDPEIYYLTREDVCYITRLQKPVGHNDFLSVSSPTSSLFGCDRGRAIDRYYIENFLLSSKLNYSLNPKKTIEVGETVYSEKYFPDAEHDILDYANGMDLTKWDTLKERGFDAFICTQVFNFIYDIRGAIHGAKYMLDNGGWLIGTVAGNISQISQSDMNNYGDYWRFTYLSIKKLLEEEFDFVEVCPFGNAFAATAFVQGLSIEDLAPDQMGMLDVKDDAYSVLIGFVCRKE